MKDIFMIGAEAKSREYYLVDQKGADASIVSTSSGVASASWVAWCPRTKLEISGTLGIESLKLDLEHDKASDGRHIGNYQDELTLLSADLNFEKVYYKWLSLIGEANIREDIIFYDSEMLELREEKIMNLELLIGGKLPLLRLKRFTTSPYLLVGVARGMGSEAEIKGGGVIKLGVKTLLKHRKRLSWATDLYFRERHQEINRIEQTARELGLALKVIFTP